MHFKSNCEGSHRISFAWRSEHKFRDPLLRTKSNFPFVRSLGKGSRVQRVPPKPIRWRQLAALCQFAARESPGLWQGEPKVKLLRRKRFDKIYMVCLGWLNVKYTLYDTQSFNSGRWGTLQAMGAILQSSWKWDARDFCVNAYTEDICYLYI